MNGNETKRRDYDRAIAKGAMFNVLGMVGKAMFPVFFIIAARLYGTTVTGVYYLAFTIIDIALSLVSAGFNSGTIMFASRYSDFKDKEDVLYQALANGFVFSLLTASVLIGFTFVGGPELILAGYSQAHLVETVRVMTFAVPLVVVSNIIIDATKAHMTMKWDALLRGFVRPTMLTLFSVVFYYLGMGLSGLVLAYVLSQAVVTVACLFVFPLYFSYKRLFHHIRHFRPFVPLLKFAIPQNLNMTFNTFITNLDVIMLGYFGLPEAELFVYGMGAQLVRNIRQVKLALSGSFAPLIAKFHEQKNIDGMNSSFSMVSRWIISLGLPLAVVVSVLRLDLLRLFDSTFSGDTSFVLLLLVPPLLSCGFGLAGNIVVMTGHSGWNLLNSFTVAGANTLLNYILIPRYGMMGAAVATVIASTAISALQLLEAYFLEGTRLIFRAVYKPYLAILPAVAIAVAYASFSTEIDTLPARIGVAALCVAAYLFTLLRLGVDPRDKQALMPWYRDNGGGTK